MFSTYVRPIVGALPAAEVDEHHVAAILQPVRDRGAIAQADAIQVLLKTFFNWARVNAKWKRAGISVNPIAAAPRLAPPKVRTRRLNDQELKAFWLSLDHAPIDRSTDVGLRLSLVMGRR